MRIPRPSASPQSWTWDEIDVLGTAPATLCVSVKVPVTARDVVAPVGWTVTASTKLLPGWTRVGGLVAAGPENALPANVTTSMIHSARPVFVNVAFPVVPQTPAQAGSRTVGPKMSGFGAADTDGRMPVPLRVTVRLGAKGSSVFTVSVAVPNPPPAGLKRIVRLREPFAGSVFGSAGAPTTVKSPALGPVMGRDSTVRPQPRDET